MRAYLFKEGLMYKLLTQDGSILSCWPFQSEKKALDSARQYESEGYHIEVVRMHWNDERVSEAKQAYCRNYDVPSFDGKCS